MTILPAVFAVNPFVGCPSHVVDAARNWQIPDSVSEDDSWNRLGSPETWNRMESFAMQARTVLQEGQCMAAVSHLDQAFVMVRSLKQSGNRSWVIRYAIEDLEREARALGLPDSGSGLRTPAHFSDPEFEVGTE